MLHRSRWQFTPSFRNLRPVPAHFTPTFASAQKTRAKCKKRIKGLNLSAGYCDSRIYLSEVQLADYFNVQILTAGSEDDNITGTSGDDILRGSQGNDFIIGGAGNDYLRGGAHDDMLWGSAGDDRLEGATGNDDLRGGQGADLLYGGSGDDIIRGDYGADSLTGGSGNDLFYFDKRTAGKDDKTSFASDTIRDFEIGDAIQFDKFKSATELVFVQDGSNTQIYIDVRGDGTPDYLAVTVLNSVLAEVEAATFLGDLAV